jgi:hypothetical protein
MTYRPFFRSGIDELESFFNEAKDLEALKKLEAELQFRSTPRAVNLLRKVQEAARKKDPTPQSAHKMPEMKESHQGHDPLPASPLGGAEQASGTNHNQSPTEVETGVRKLETGADKKEDFSNSAPLPSQAERYKSDSEAESLSDEKSSTNNHRRLVDLLAYLEHLAKLGEKPVFTLKEYQQLVLQEAEVKGQAGISHDVSSEEAQIWLKIDRLQRTEPPLPAPELRDWIALSRDPYQPPKIQAFLNRTITKF